MIDELTVINDAKDTKVVQKVMHDIHQNAVGVVYSSTTAVSADMVPAGKLLIADDGNTIMLFFKGQGDSVGSVAMTVVT